MTKAEGHIRNISLTHFVFSLPFAYMGAFLAAKGMPNIWDLFWITLAMMGARSAAMGLDNLFDAEYDKLQPRLKNRPLVLGVITKNEVKLSILLSLLLFFIAVFHLKPICLKLLPIATIPFIIYPFTKRFTWFCHGVLGLAIAMAPAGGWVAIAGTVGLTTVVLSLGVAVWIGTFDAIYGAQDEKFDLAHNLHSLATKFGAKKALLIARYLHFFAIFCFILVGFLENLSFLYYIGVFLAALTLVYQHSIVKADDFHCITQLYFLRNGLVSLLIFIFTVFSLP